MFSEERISATELQRRGERSETMRDVLVALTSEEPAQFSPQGYAYCAYCMVPLGDDLVPTAHKAECPWLRAKNLLSE